MIRYGIADTIIAKGLKEILLREADLLLSEKSDLCRITQKAAISVDNRSNEKGTYPKAGSSGSWVEKLRIIYRFCGTSHPPRNCLAYGEISKQESLQGYVHQIKESEFYELLPDEEGQSEFYELLPDEEGQDVSKYDNLFLNV